MSACHSCTPQCTGAIAEEADESSTDAPVPAPAPQAATLQLPSINPLVVTKGSNQLSVRSVSPLMGSTANLTESTLDLSKKHASSETSSFSSVNPKQSPQEQLQQQQSQQQQGSNEGKQSLEAPISFSTATAASVQIHVTNSSTAEIQPAIASDASSDDDDGYDTPQPPATLASPSIKISAASPNQSAANSSTGIASRSGTSIASQPNQGTSEKLAQDITVTPTVTLRKPFIVTLTRGLKGLGFGFSAPSDESEPGNVFVTSINGPPAQESQMKAGLQILRVKGTC